MSFSLRTGFAALALLAGVSGASAFELHPTVAQPLNTLQMAAAQHCQAGHPQACSIGQYLNAVAGELMGVQNACMHGNTYACNQLNMAAMQLNAQVQAMNAPAGIPGGQMMTHDQRMAYQRQQFAAHQARMAQRSAAMDRSHQSFLEYLRQ